MTNLPEYGKPKASEDYGCLGCVSVLLFVPGFWSVFALLFMPGYPPIWHWIAAVAALLAGGWLITRR